MVFVVCKYLLVRDLNPRLGTVRRIWHTDGVLYYTYIFVQVFLNQSLKKCYNFSNFDVVSCRIELVVLGHGKERTKGTYYAINWYFIIFVCVRL